MPEVFHQNDIESSQHRQGMRDADIRDRDQSSVMLIKQHPYTTPSRYSHLMYNTD